MTGIRKNGGKSTLFWAGKNCVEFAVQIQNVSLRTSLWVCLELTPVQQ